MQITRQKKILLIGCGTGVGHYIDLADSLSKKLPDYEIVFRPHPNETLKTYEYLEKNNKHVAIDQNLDIYKSLEHADAIVSEVSTVLFEAIGIVNKIIVYETDYSANIMPEHPFNTCKNTDDICNTINSSEEQKYCDAEFWDKNWKINYKNFLHDLNII